MNIEQTCADAIAVVERYLFTAADSDMRDELHEAARTVSYVWDVCKSRKSHRQCRAAWTACLSAVTGHTSTAEMYVDEYWELVK
jgi:hypothetical protein